MSYFAGFCSACLARVVLVRPLLDCSRSPVGRVSVWCRMRPSPQVAQIGLYFPDFPMAGNLLETPEHFSLCCLDYSVPCKSICINISY